MAGRAVGPTLRTVLGAGAVILPAALAGCSSIDHGQARLCRSVVPAIEQDGRIAVIGLATDPDLAHGISVDYRVIPERGPARRGLVRCAFGGGRLDGDRLTLLGVEVNGDPLPEGRLFALERFWLADADAVGEGEKRLVGVTDEPLTGITLPPRTAYWTQQVVNALPLAAFYSFLAVAYALIYGLVNRINLAFGEIAVVGAYAAVAAVLSFGAGLAAGPAGGVALAVVLSLTAALLHGALVGASIGELVFRPLARAGHRSFLIATIGLSIALMEAMRLLAGSRDRWIQPVLNEPLVLFGGPFEVTITTMQAVEIAGAAAVLALLLRTMTGTAFGRAWRAIADDPLMARFLGVDAGRIAVLTFALSSALAALAGGFSALHYGQATYGSGTLVGLKALVAALLGGIGSLPGAALGGLAIGLFETLWSAAMPVEWRDAVILAALVVILVFRPEGLFGVARPTADTGDGRWSGRA